MLRRELDRCLTRHARAGRQSLALEPEAAHLIREIQGDIGEIWGRYALDLEPEAGPAAVPSLGRSPDPRRIALAL